LYVPAIKPDMVILLPVPVIAPGLITQFPAGKPERIILPVATSQVGCITWLIIGAGGGPGCAIITTLADTEDMHPAAFVTVYE